MRVLLVGHGRMGRLVESLVGEYGGEIIGVVDPESPSHSGPIDDERWGQADVAIDFTSPDAVMANVPSLTRRGINVVLGTTGWQRHETALRENVAASGVGVVAAPNFSPGVVMFEAVVACAAKLFGARDEFGAFLHEAHHAMKKDAPSGVADARHGDGRLCQADRRLLHPGGSHSGYPYGRFRRPFGIDYALAYGAGSRRIRARRAAGRPLAPGEAGLVHNARRSGAVRSHPSVGGL